MIPNHCFLDLETKKPFTTGGEVVPSWWDPEQELTKAEFFTLGFGMACTYDNSGVKFWNDPTELFMHLVNPAIDAVVTFNGERFDFPIILAEIEPPTLTDGKYEFSEGFKEAYLQIIGKSIDILAEVEKTLGHRVQLDQITSAIFEVSKESDAKTWWSSFNSPGIIKRTNAINYLLGDVFQLYRIYAVASEIGQLAYRDQLGNTRKFDIKIKTIQDL